MDITSIFVAMIKLFLILLVGCCCHKWKVFPDATQAILTRLVLYVATPCTILYSVLGSEKLPEPATMLVILAATVGCYVIVFLMGLGAVRLLRVPVTQRGAFLCMLLCSNCAFVGFPVVQAIFGQEAVFYAAVANMPFFPVLYGVGARYLQQDGALLRGEGSKSSVRLRDFINPCLVASLITIVLALTAVRAPEVLTDTISMLANITTPASLLVIGISIGKQPLRAILGSPRLYAITLLRLAVIPAIVWAVLGLFLSDVLILGTLTVLFAMPVAASVPMVAVENGADEQVIVQSVFITTLLSMLTIPLLVSILM